MGVPESVEVRDHRNQIVIKGIIRQETAIKKVENGAKKVFGSDPNSPIDKAAKAVWGVTKGVLRNRTGRVESY